MEHNTHDDDDGTARNIPADDDVDTDTTTLRAQPPVSGTVTHNGLPRSKSAPPGKRIDINRMARRLHIAPREARVLACVDAGLHTPQIAATLNITEHTVKHYFKDINLKLGTHSRLEAMQHWHHAIREMEREGRPPWIEDPAPHADPAPPTPPPSTPGKST